MKNMYKTEKAMHEAMNAATLNLKQAQELKDSLKQSPIKTTAHSNVSNKRKRATRIINAMQKRYPQKFKKEYSTKNYAYN